MTCTSFAVSAAGVSPYVTQTVGSVTCSYKSSGSASDDDTTYDCAASINNGARLCACCPGPQPTPRPTIVEEATLVLYASFNGGDATDDSGNGFDGTLTGTTGTTGPDGSRALEFDGSDRQGHSSSTSEWLRDHAGQKETHGRLVETLVKRENDPSRHVRREP